MICGADTQANLNWKVVNQSICRVGRLKQTDDTCYKPVLDYEAIVREDTDEVFAIRHKSYRKIQV